MLSFCSRSFAKLFTKTHEWIDLNGTSGTIGISKHAEHLLGEISIIDVKTGKTFKTGQEFGEIESAKATSPILCPMTGKIVSINPKIEADPTIVNKSPESDGWIAGITVDDPNDTKHLMNEDSYKEFLKNAK